MNLYDVLNKLSDIANKHKLIGSYHNGDVYRIMNSAKNTYPVVVFTVDKLQDYQDYSTLNAYMYFIDRLTDDEDNKINIQSNGINVINDIVNKLGDIDGISPVTPLQYTFFTEKFGDMCCGVYANVSIQFNNYSNCCENFNLNTLTINENGEYILDNIDVVTVDVQPALQNKTVEYTENGEYSVTNDEEFYGLKEVKINVAIPNVSTAVTITENGTTTLTPTDGYFNEVTVNTNVLPPLQEKELPIGINERLDITPDENYYGLSKVTVQAPDVPLQNKTLNVTQNGSTRLMPDEGYYALHTVDVNVNVPEPALESKTVDITSNGTMNITPDSEYGLSNVTVNTNVQPTLQNKTVTINKNGTQTITKDDGYDGLGTVKITTNVEGGGSIGNYIKVETPIIGGNNILYSIYDTLDTTNWEFNIQRYTNIFNSIPTKKIILPIDFFYKENRNDFNEQNTFYNCSSLTEIENIDKTRISINRFYRTFYNCKKLTSLDLSYKPEYNYWDMSGVKNISYMFYNCSSLTTLNIYGWDRAKISYSRYSFGSCNNLGGIIRLSAHNAIDNSYMFGGCYKIEEIYYDNDGYDNINQNSEVCTINNFATNCIHLKKASIKGRIIHKDNDMFTYSSKLEWVDITGCDYSKYMSGDTSTSSIQPYIGCTNLKTLIGDHTLEEVENGDITIYDGLGLSQPRFSSYYLSPLSSLRYSSMLALAKGLGQHTYSSTQYIGLNNNAWNNMYNDDDTIPDSETITQRQNTLTDLITSKGWSIEYANS